MTPNSTGDHPDESGDGGPRRTARWATRRQMIIDTSASVFARNGYHNTGIADLCDANELGKGGLYHYIGSKEQLLAAIHDRVMDEVMASAERVITTSAAPTAKLEALGVELLRVITTYPDHVWVFLHEFPALTGDQAVQFRSRRRAFEEVVETILGDGIETGEFRHVDPALTARAWLGMHNYTYLWLRTGGTLTSDAVAQHFSAIFVSGLAPRSND